MKTGFTLCAALIGFALIQTSQAAINAGDTIYIDFGKNNELDGIIMPYDASMDTNRGNSTGVPDSYGNYWNNAWTNTATAGGPVPPDPLTNLVTSTNVDTGINVTFSKGWESNGFRNGGLTSPDFDLLGEIASKNATGDYFFINKPFTEDQLGVAFMTFSNLNPALTYDFKIFATRETTETRITEYAILDLNGNVVQSTLLKTSGSGIGAGGYNGNNDTFAYLTGIVPNEFGEITLRTKVIQSDYAYIGTLQITAVPEPEIFSIIAAIGCLVLVMARRRRRGA